MSDHGMTLLAIDTATEQAGVGVLRHGEVTALTWHAGRNHTVTLMAQVHHALTLADVVPTELDGVVVSLGPGTFTGLRVGIAAAKGFVLGAGMRMVGVPTLQASALPWVDTVHQVCAVVEAGRGRLVWATYARQGHDVVEITRPRNGTPEELLSEIRANGDHVLVTGECDDALVRALAEIGARIPAAPLRIRRPESLLLLGAQRMASGAEDDPATLQPIYLSR
ncbi:MAG: tRNA (adenosine(37)-N6)-threonylcarbamoyltransferase complex dimerization subunit type 1 TsaB [Chloroflexota bacterium]